MCYSYPLSNRLCLFYLYSTFAGAQFRAPKTKSAHYSYQQWSKERDITWRTVECRTLNVAFRAQLVSHYTPCVYVTDIYGFSNTVKTRELEICQLCRQLVTWLSFCVFSWQNIWQQQPSPQLSRIYLGDDDGCSRRYGGSSLQFWCHLSTITDRKCKYITRMNIAFHMPRILTNSNVKLQELKNK